MAGPTTRRPPSGSTAADARAELPCWSTRLSRYQLFVDERLLAERAGSTLSLASPQRLTRALHSWYVRAIDRAGNTRVTSTGRFRVK